LWFTQIEDQGMQVGLELARVFMQQTVQHQADGEIPQQAVDCDGELAVIHKDGPHKTTLDTPAGEVEWQQPKTRLKKTRRDFFPQAKALGIDVDEMLSPSLLEKVSYVGTLLKSFRQGDVAIDKLLTGLKTRPGCVWNWADVVMEWLLPTAPMIFR